MDAMTSRMLSAVGLLLMIAVIVLVLFWIIAEIDDIEPDAIFILFRFTVVYMIYAVIVADSLYEYLLYIAVEIILFVLNKITFRSIRSLYCMLALEFVIAALTNFRITITIAIVACIVSKFRSLKERTKQNE